MIDISVAAQKARAARFATSFDNTSVGPAGVSGTRKVPALLTDKQAGFINTLCHRIRGKQRRAEFKAATMDRLSGSVGDAAVMAACTAAAIEAGLSPEKIGLAARATRRGVDTLPGGGKVVQKDAIL
jgi:hypothetical protein